MNTFGWSYTIVAVAANTEGFMNVDLLIGGTLGLKLWYYYYFVTETRLLGLNVYLLVL